MKEASYVTSVVAVSAHSVRTLSPSLCIMETTELE